MKRKAPKPAEQALVTIMKCLLKGINRKGFAVLDQFGVQAAESIPI
jgi:hypothetical protein